MRADMHCEPALPCFAVPFKWKKDGGERMQFKWWFKTTPCLKRLEIEDTLFYVTINLISVDNVNRSHLLSLSREEREEGGQNKQEFKSTCIVKAFFTLLLGSVTGPTPALRLLSASCPPYRQRNLAFRVFSFIHALFLFHTAWCRFTRSVLIPNDLFAAGAVTRNSNKHNFISQLVNVGGEMW